MGRAGRMLRNLATATTSATTAATYLMWSGTAAVARRGDVEDELEADQVEFARRRMMRYGVLACDTGHSERCEEFRATFLFGVVSGSSEQGPDELRRQVRRELLSELHERVRLRDDRRPGASDPGRVGSKYDPRALMVQYEVANLVHDDVVGMKRAGIGGVENKINLVGTDQQPARCCCAESSRDQLDGPAALLAELVSETIQRERSRNWQGVNGINALRPSASNGGVHSGPPNVAQATSVIARRGLADPSHGPTGIRSPLPAQQPSRTNPSSPTSDAATARILLGYVPDLRLSWAKPHASGTGHAR